MVGVGAESQKAERERPQKRLRKSRREEREQDALEREQQLASDIFGGGHMEDAIDQRNSETASASDDDGEVFQIERLGQDATVAPNEEHAGIIIDEATGAAHDTGNEVSSPAWIDDDDENFEVDLLRTSRLRKLRTSKQEGTASALVGTEFEKRLRTRYQSTTGTMAKTEWASIPRDKEAVHSDTLSIDENEAQFSSTPLLRASEGVLPPNVINIVRCPDANQADPCKAVVQAVHFHPGSDPNRPLLLTAGLDKTLRFFQVGAESSEKVHGIHCKLTLISQLDSVCETPRGSLIITSSKAANL